MEGKIFNQPPKQEELPKIEISLAIPEDVFGMRELEYKTWMATYPGEESGITTNDIEWYFKEFKKSFSPSNLEKTASEIENLPTSQKVLVAKNEDGEMVGFSWLMRGNDVNELGSIYIDPKVQGVGLGTKIYEEAKNFFDKNKDVFLTVEEHNSKAIGFYKKLGFEEVGKRAGNLSFPSGAKFNEIEMLNRANLAEEEQVL